MKLEDLKLGQKFYIGRKRFQIVNLASMADTPICMMSVDKSRALRWFTLEQFVASIGGKK
jgi:hypothetical protein